MRGDKPKRLAVEKNGPANAPPPDWLSDEAKAEWRRVLPILVEREILSDADLGALAGYCSSYGLAQECARDIRVSGPFYKTEGGMKKSNPALAAHDRALAQCRLWASELGLTPVSRSRPAVIESSGDEWSDLV